jgi:ParB family transcriptional regulator, chromosome partitioning protein
MTKIALKEIKVGFRTRFDNGNIAELTEDIKLHGLLHPIIVSPDNELIAGFRRLKAIESLGWNEIPISIIDSKQSLDQFDIQISENMQRKDLNPLEISDAILERKHRFEQIYGKIQNGGDHCSEEYQKSRFANSKTAFPDFFEETAKLLKMGAASIRKFLVLNNIDADLKEKVSTREINYQAALTQQADRNRQKKTPIKKSAKHGSFRLPNQEQIAPFQAQYQTAPNLMQLFMLIQHSFQQVQRMQEKPLEYDKFELEYSYMLTQQMEVVMGFYSEVLTQLHQTQENKLKALTTEDTEKN